HLHGLLPAFFRWSDFEGCAVTCFTLIVPVSSINENERGYRRSVHFGSDFMTGKAATLLDGRQLATAMQAEIAAAVHAQSQKSHTRPGLAAVLVGDNPASQVYVRNKRKACAKVGIESWLHELPGDCSQERLLELISRLNADPLVDGILVQLPLPGQIDEGAI